MSGNTNEKRIIAESYLRNMICALLITLVVGCGSDSKQAATDNNTYNDNNTPTSDASGTGKVTFTVQWETDGANIVKSAGGITRTAIEDCGAIGIQTITCNVYDASKNLVANGGPWPCAERRADMVRIPAGSNLTFTILGWDAENGKVIYRGSTPADVTIIPGEITDAGTITATPFLPKGLKATTVSKTRIDLVWNDIGAASYRIYQDGKLAATPTSAGFSVTHLAAGAQHCFTVSALDDFGNESGLSDQACATTAADNITAPLDPKATDVSASQIDITWKAPTSNAGIAGYVVYQKGNRDIEVGKTTAKTTSFSHGNLSPNTQYCYSVAAHDAIGKVFPQSGQVCARTRQIFVWYRDEDQDNYGDPTISTQAENAPPGYVRDNTDCDDKLATVHPNAREMCNDADDNCNQEIDENCTTLTTASFTAHMEGGIDFPGLYGDARDQEGNPFNSNTLFTSRRNNHRTCLEFDIRYPPGNSDVTLEFEMINQNDPYDATVYMYSYYANGQANSQDYNYSNTHAYIGYFRNSATTDKQVYRFNVSNAFLTARDAGQTHLGILILTTDLYSHREITNPSITVDQN